MAVPEADFQDQYLDLDGLAKYSSMSKSTLREYIKGEGLPAFKVKGKLLVKQSEFDNWMEGFRLQSEDIDSIVEALAS